MTESIKADFQEAAKVLQEFIEYPDNLQNIAKAGRLMVDSLQSGHKIISCGNGGSMSDAMHFAEELSGRFRESRKAMAALAISDPTHLSCTANDYGYASVFSRYIEALGQAGDCLLSISTSGNSANVLKAAEAAKNQGIKVIALSGKDGGKLAQIADVEIRVAHFGYSDRIQEIHIKIIHSLIHFIEEHTKI